MRSTELKTRKGLMSRRLTVALATMIAAAALDAGPAHAIG